MWNVGRRPPLYHSRRLLCSLVDPSVRFSSTHRVSSSAGPNKKDRPKRKNKNVEAGCIGPPGQKVNLKIASPGGLYSTPGLY
jgi:hypothetical protein